MKILNPASAEPASESFIQKAANVLRAEFRERNLFKGGPEMQAHQLFITRPGRRFDQKRVLNRLDVLSRKAEELGQISAVARCDELIGKHRGMFTDRTALEWDFDPSKLTVEQLDVLADQFIRQALNTNDPAPVKQKRRELQAKVRAIEGTAEHVPAASDVYATEK